MNVGGESAPKGRRSQDFDLNLAPIIDCFTVLITFILASTSYLAVGLLDAGAAVDGPAPPDAKPPAIRLDIRLTAKREIQLRISGKEKRDKTIPAPGTGWDGRALLAEIDSVRKRWPDTRSAVLSADDDVEYEAIVLTMDMIRSKLPTLLLEGPP